jgi:hypothetical protein
MVPEEQSTPTGDRTFRLSRKPRHPLLDRGRVPGANKRSILGALALAFGVAAATSIDGLIVGVPLIAVGGYLVSEPLLGVRRPG